MVKKSIFAAQEREHRLDSLGDTLSELAQIVDFKAIAEDVDAAVPRPDRSAGGRPPFPTELMVRILVVQSLHNLSDEQTEFQLLDRLSFQRFVGLRHSSQVPDRTTIWNFKERLVKAGVKDIVFESFNRQLSALGYVARSGQMVDATLVPTPTQRMTDEEREQIRAGEKPEGWSEPKLRQKDADSDWTKKHGKWVHGMKLSVSTDCRYKLMRKVKVSPANEHDSRHFEDVIDETNTSREIYADKGYVGQEREKRLVSKGYRPKIQRKAKQGKPLSDCQKRRNRKIASIRARVEHPFLCHFGADGSILPASKAVA